MMIKRYKRTPFRRRPLLNHWIPFSRILIIDDQGKRLGEYDLESGLELARSKELDLFCINPENDPPICKILNYDRYRYLKQKQAKQFHQKHGTVSEKKLRITPTISDNDLQIKINQCRKFLSQKHKVRLTMRLRGREKYLSNYGRDKFELFVTKVSDLCRPLKPIKLLNFQYQITFEPK